MCVRVCSFVHMCMHYVLPSQNLAKFAAHCALEMNGQKHLDELEDYYKLPDGGYDIHGS